VICIRTLFESRQELENLCRRTTGLTLTFDLLTPGSIWPQGQYMPSARPVLYLRGV